MFSGKKLPMWVTGLEEGDIVASIKKINVSRREKRIAFFSVESNDRPEEEKDKKEFLFYNDVVGIGNYAVMTMDSTKITTIDDENTVAQMDKDSTALVDAQLITISGDVIGKVTDFFFNEQSGMIEKIVGLMAENQEEKEFMAPMIISIGAGMVIVNTEEGTSMNAAVFPQSQFIQQGYAPQSQFVQQPYAPQPQFVQQPYAPQSQFGQQPYAQQPYAPQSQFGQQPYVQQPYAPQPQFGQQPYVQQPYAPQSQFGQQNLTEPLSGEIRSQIQSSSPMNYPTVHDALQEALKPKPMNVGEPMQPQAMPSVSELQQDMQSSNQDTQEEKDDKKEKDNAKDLRDLLGAGRRRIRRS